MPEKKSDQKEFTVSRQEVDKRLDSALVNFPQTAEAAPIPSRARLTRLIKAGVVLVNGAATKPHHQLRLGDIILVPAQAFKKSQTAFPRTTRLTLNILFENEDFLIVSKPAGLLAHPAEAGPQDEETLAHALIMNRPELLSVGEDRLRPGLVHRLDRETSGLLVVAKNQETFSALKALFQGRTVKKTYLALVHGHVPQEKGRIDTPLTRYSGERKRSVAYPDTLSRARPAVTEYELLVRYGEYDLLWVFPKTGRTRQIRVHLASLGHPLVGDTLYAFRAHKRQKPLAERQMLHAYRLEFSLDGRPYRFEAPLPEDFRQVLRHIDESRGEGYDGKALKDLS